MGKVYGRSAPDFAADAVRLAVADAGLTLDDVDGLLINPGLSGGLDIGIAARLGLYNLPLLSVVNVYGSTASVMVMMASLAIAAGPGDHGRVRLRRRDVDAAQPHRRGVRRRWRCRPSVQGHPGARGGRGSRRRAQHLRAGGASSHGQVRHERGPLRRGRGDAARLGGRQRARADARPDHRRGSPPLALDRRAVPAPRLLPRVERRCRGRGHVGRARPRPPAAAGVHLGLGPGPSRVRDGARLRVGSDHRRGAVGPGRVRDGGDRARRHRRRRDLRLLHVHGDRLARGLRLLREG